ncbi:MAG: MFS transporter [Treponema sp.]|nr:MFS transporter [Treponema sp.]
MTTTTDRSGRLSLGTKLGFGVCDLGGNLFFTALGFWALKYLTDTVGIAAAVAGTVIMAGKLVDALWDPVLGYLSDRTRTRWGRRRPYIFFGSVPLAFAMWWFFTNPHIQSPVLLTAWAALSFIALNVIYSIVNIPYSSLTPELTQDYHERSSLNGFRFMFAVLGTLLGAASVPPLLAAFGGVEGADKSLGFSMMGLLFGAVMLVTAMTTALTVREPAPAPESEARTEFSPEVGAAAESDPDPRRPVRKAAPPVAGAAASARRSGRGDFLRTYLSVFRNRPYLIVLLTYALNLIGLTFLQGIIAYYFQYIYAREDLTALAMLVLLVTAMVFIPVSVIVSKRIGKKRTYQICFFALGSASLVLFFLGQALGPWFFIGMMVYAGIGVGFGYVAPYSMVPDTIELDAARTGARKEGAFYGMWLLTSKIGSAVAMFASGLVLSFGGFVPNAAQAPASQLAIRLLIGPIPAVFLLGALFLIDRYPIDEKSYGAALAGAARAAAAEARAAKEAHGGKEAR